MTSTPSLATPRAFWRKSRHSANAGNCVEVAAIAKAIAVRDSKDPNGGQLVLSPQRWRRFTAKVRTGTFDAS